MNDKQSDYFNNIANDLRGTVSNTNWPLTLLIGGLLVFTAGNTLNLFSKSFQALGILFAIAAIFFFDGGFVAWGEARKRYAKSSTQDIISRTGQAMCASAAVSMTAIDVVLHSGQTFIPLDAIVTVWGWQATVYQVFGGAAIFILIGIIILNIGLVVRFEHADVDISLRIQERFESFKEKQHDLSLRRAGSALMSNQLADTIQEMQHQYEARKGEIAAKALDSLMPKLYREFDDMIDGAYDRNDRKKVIPAKFNQQPARGFAVDTDEFREPPKPPSGVPAPQKPKFNPNEGGQRSNPPRGERK